MKNDNQLINEAYDEVRNNLDDLVNMFDADLPSIIDDILQDFAEHLADTFDTGRAPMQPGLETKEGTEEYFFRYIDDMEVTLDDYEEDEDVDRWRIGLAYIQNNPNEFEAVEIEPEMFIIEWNKAQ